MIGKFFCLLVWYLSLIFQILLVSYENSWDIFLSMFINFAHPLWNLRERFSISDIISDNNTMGTLIITACDSLESFLTCSIPNLQFNSFLIHINSSDFEINTNCWHEIIVENIILKKRARLDLSIDFILTANLKSNEDFPTPEFPIRSTLKR